MIERFRSFRNVFIEDDVLITNYENEDFTRVPRTVVEIKNCIAREDDEIHYYKIS